MLSSTDEAYDGPPCPHGLTRSPFFVVDLELSILTSVGSTISLPLATRDAYLTSSISSCQTCQTLKFAMSANTRLNHRSSRVSNLYDAALNTLLLLYRVTFPSRNGSMGPWDQKYGTRSLNRTSMHAVSHRKRQEALSHGAPYE